MRDYSMPGLDRMQTAARRRCYRGAESLHRVCAVVGHVCGQQRSSACNSERTNEQTNKKRTSTAATHTAGCPEKALHRS